MVARSKIPTPLEKLTQVCIGSLLGGQIHRREVVEQAAASCRIREVVDTLTQQIVETLSRRAEPGRPLHIEDIQDQVVMRLSASCHLVGLSRTHNRQSPFIA